ncbi:MAG: HAD family hydrolase [Solirubrobacteraceae bacterium]
MNEEPELVIFDCDGVLVDSERLAVDICVEICAEHGLELTREEIIERFMGRSAGLIEAMIEERLGRVLTDAERRRNGSRFTAVYERDLVGVAGAAQALAAITHSKCVASGSRPAAIRRKLELCGLLEHFDGNLFSAFQVAHGKPAPDLFLFAAAQMGVEPSRCVVVEDSPYGVQAARAAGMPALAYAGGMVRREALASPGATVFDDMRELPALLSTAG